MIQRPLSTRRSHPLLRCDVIMVNMNRGGKRLPIRRGVWAAKWSPGSIAEVFIISSDESSLTRRERCRGIDTEFCCDNGIESIVTVPSARFFPWAFCSIHVEYVQIIAEKRLKKSSNIPAVRWIQPIRKMLTIIQRGTDQELVTPTIATVTASEAVTEFTKSFSSLLNIQPRLFEYCYFFNPNGKKL